MRKRLTAALVALGGAALARRALRRLRAESLDGRVVLVAGGTRGLGLALARAFGGEGARVAICGRDPETLDAALADLAERGIEAFGRTCDVADEPQVAQVVRAVEARWGRIDVLANVAAVIDVGPAGVHDAETFERTMAINFRGPLHAIRQVLPGMLERGWGRIVNITSIGGKVSVPRLLPYGCAKFALVGLSEGLRAELGGTGVKVTTVVPGLMRTGSHVNARYVGDPEAEMSWFSLGSATPASAMMAERAARRIVLAARAGEAEVVLSWQAKLLIALHTLSPGLVQDGWGLVHRLLPGGEGAGAPFAGPGQPAAKGRELATPIVPSPLTLLAQRAARRLHQYRGGGPVDPEHERRSTAARPAP